MATRQTYYSASNTESTTTSTSNQTKTTLTFTPDASSDYLLFWRASILNTSSSADTRVNFYNGTTTLSSVAYEPKDVSDYISVGGIVQESFGASPSSMSYLIRYSSESGVATAKIKDARALAVKKGANDQYASSDAESSTTSGTPTAKATLTFTPATSGDYLIIAAAEIKCDSTSGEVNCQLDINGTDYHVMSHRPGDATTYISWHGMRKVNLAASSQTIKIEYFRTTAGTAYIKNARIIALRWDDLNTSQYAEELTRQTRANTAYASVKELNFTPSAVDYVVFACATYDYTNANNSASLQLTEAGATDTETIQETVLAANEMPFFTFYQKELTASSTTWAIQHKCEVGTDTVGTDDAAIAVLQVEEVAAAAVAGGFQVLDGQFVANYGGQGFIDPTIQKLH